MTRLVRSAAAGGAAGRLRRSSPAASDIPPLPCWLKVRVFQSEDMSRHYPSRPVVGVGAIITQGDAVLLVRRGRAPQKGNWSIPGGVLQVGETLEEGVRREVREEVGLDVQVIERVEVVERILPDAAGKLEYHYVLIDYLCEPAGGTLQAADDAAEAVWVDRGDLDQYQITPGTTEVINRAFEIRGRLAGGTEGA